MKLLLSLLPALLGAIAYADGVPLITPGTMPPAGDIIYRQTLGQSDFVKVHPILLNKNALASNVLTVVIEGKEYRFVGSSKIQKTQVHPSQPEQREYQVWTGSTGPLTVPGVPFAQPATMTVVRGTKDGLVDGVIRMPPAREFEVLQSGMIERDPGKRAYPALLPAASGASK